MLSFALERCGVKASNLNAMLSETGRITFVDFHYQVTLKNKKNTVFPPIFSKQKNRRHMSMLAVISLVFL